MNSGVIFDFINNGITLAENIDHFVASDGTKILDSINFAGTKDSVVLLGKKTNPYPYIKACDIYVQPSRFEGHSVTVREAQIIGKPVIITNYPTAKSQVQDGVDGVICPMDNERIADAIFSLANDKQKQAQLIEYVSSHDYGNESEVEKIYKLLNV